MKYNDEQIDNIIRKGLSMHISQVRKREKLKKTFPIKVELIGGYYVIESKINKL